MVLAISELALKSVTDRFCMLWYVLHMLGSCTWIVSGTLEASASLWASIAVLALRCIFGTGLLLVGDAYGLSTSRFLLLCKSTGEFCCCPKTFVLI